MRCALGGGGPVDMHMKGSLPAYPGGQGKWYMASIGQEGIWIARVDEHFSRSVCRRTTAWRMVARARKADGGDKDCSITCSRFTTHAQNWHVAGSITAVAQIMLAVLFVRSAMLFSQVANAHRMTGERAQKTNLLWL